MCSWPTEPTTASGSSIGRTGERSARSAGTAATPASCIGSTQSRSIRREISTPEKSKTENEYRNLSLSWPEERINHDGHDVHDVQILCTGFLVRRVRRAVMVDP